MCVLTYACSRAWHVHMEPSGDFGYLPLSLFTYLLRQGLALNAEFTDWLNQLIRMFWASPVLALPSARVIESYGHVWLFGGCSELRSSQCLGEGRRFNYRPSPKFYHLLAFFLRQGFSVRPWPCWRLFYRPGWHHTQRFACFCLSLKA